MTTTTEFLNAMTMFCLKHDRPILRVEMIKNLGMNKRDITMMERKRLLEAGYYTQGNGTYLKGYYPKGFEETKKKVKAEQKAEAERQRWAKANPLVRGLKRLLDIVGLKKLAKKLYEYQTKARQQK